MAKKASAPDGKICSNCLASEGSASAPKLSACSRCGLVLYCDRKCQAAHWKANHKQYCIAKADRAPPPSLTPSNGHESTKSGNQKSKSSNVAMMCAICQDKLAGASATTPPCNHEFHDGCVEELRKYGVNEVCPLCREPLPTGAEKTCEEATRRFFVIDRMVERGFLSWSALSPGIQLELDSIRTQWLAAANEGYEPAQFNLGMMYDHG